MKKPPDVLRIGAGASFADDRIAPAVELAEHGELDYLVFECLAERTVARENQTRLKNPEKGYTPRLLDRMAEVLPVCARNDVRIVSNMGAANPTAAAQLIRRYATDSGLGDVSCAVVLGDDVAEIGRAFLYGLGAMGEAGVSKVLELIHRELDLTMAFCGVRDIRDVDRTVLLPATVPSIR